MAALIAQTWQRTAIRDEAVFRAAADKVASAVLACRQKDDPQGAHDWLECLIGARRLAAGGPISTSYAHYLGEISVTMAEWLVCHHHFTAALEVAAQAWETLEAVSAQRRGYGLPPLRSNPSRWALLGSLANVKWRAAGEEFRDIVMTPTEHVKAWLGFSDALHEELARPLPGAGPASDHRELRRREERDIESLLWAGVWTACCAQRYCHREQFDLVREFNIWHAGAYGSAGMALAERHWLEAAPFVKESPLYWQFEIAKQWLAEQKQARPGYSLRSLALTLDELDELYGQLRLKVSLSTAGQRDRALERGRELDYHWMYEALLAHGSASDELQGRAGADGAPSGGRAACPPLAGAAGGSREGPGAARRRLGQHA